MKKIFAKTLLVLIAVTMSATMALAALSLEAAKQQGLVGEKPDGLLGIVTQSAETQALVTQINTERLAKYKDIAVKNGAPVTQIQAVAGKKLIESTPSGQYIMSISGNWQKK